MSRETLIKNLMAVKKEIEPGQAVEVGMFRPEDALGISLAYLAIYGDAFPVEHVYDPKEIIQRNAGEDQYTVVARTPRGEVVGLSGLFRHTPDPDIYEFGQLMVLKSYRKSRLAMEIADQTAGVLPHRLGIPVVFGEAVCNHVISQQLACRQGFRFTGLEVECMPSSIYAGEGGATRNVSLLLTFKIIRSTPSMVHVPPAYEAFITGMYVAMGLEREYAPAAAPGGKTAYEDFILPETGLARITVKKAGTDLQEIIDRARIKAGHSALVQIYLNLGDPAAPDVVAMLRTKGFFFGGLLPQWFGSDGLIMQNVPQAPDWDTIRLYNEAAVAIRDYVRRDYEAITGQ